jgi:hypothetical protein
MGCVASLKDACGEDWRQRLEALATATQDFYLSLSPRGLYQIRIPSCFGCKYSILYSDSVVWKWYYSQWVLYLIATDPGTITRVQGVGFSSPKTRVVTHMILQTRCRVRYFSGPNLYKLVSHVLPVPSSSKFGDPNCTIYYLGYPLGRFAELKQRQPACQVGVIVKITGWMRRTFTCKINLHDSRQLNSRADSISCSAQCYRVEVTDFWFLISCSAQHCVPSSRNQSVLRTRQDQYQSRDSRQNQSSTPKQVKSIYHECYSQFAWSAAHLLGVQS